MTVGSVNPFKPAQTLTIAASTAAASASLPIPGDAVLIFNSTSAVAFVAVGTGAVTATTASYPVPAGGRALIATGPYVNALSVVLSTGSGTVYATVGDGTQY